MVVLRGFRKREVTLTLQKYVIVDGKKDNRQV